MINLSADTSRIPWIAALMIAVVFFTTNGVLTYHYTRLMAQNTADISQTMHTLSLIEAIKAQLFRAESAQRGYLITSDEQYLAPYSESVVTLRSLLISLEELTQGISRQQERFQQMYQHMSDKLQEMDQTIQLIATNQDRAAMRLVDSHKGYRLGLNIIAIIEAIEADEHVLLQQSREQAGHNHELMIWTLLITNGAGLCLALAAMYGTLRYSNRISNLYKEIEQANTELEDKVQQRTMTLKRYAEELERSNRELEDFAFVASHDLQEPLRKIRAFSDRLVKKYSEELGEQGRDYINRMHAASERMSRLIEDLLNFSRVSTRQKDFEPVDLNNTLQEVVDNLEFAISARSANIQIDPLPTIDGDASQLRQVFTNLLANSLKFTAAEVTPEIQVTATHSSDNETQTEEVCIAVKDNGIGFDEQYKDRIFNLFQRLHGRDEYTGTGIGLAICRKIVERHGGRIEVRSEIGVGTEFFVYLPVNQQHLHQHLLEAGT